MNEISIPTHLIIPALHSILLLVLIFLYRKKLFASGKWKWFWISTTLFLGIYFLIVSRATYVDISLELALQKFDLNGDGIFSGEEITPDQKEAMKRVISDTGRNFSFITGLIFSGIIALFVFIVGKIVEFIRAKRAKTTH